MTEREAEHFLAEVGEVSAAMRSGELGRARELLRACRMNERLEAGPLPAGALGAAIRTAVDEALLLALDVQSNRREAISQVGTSRRALGAYRRRR